MYGYKNGMNTVFLSILFSAFLPSFLFFVHSLFSVSSPISHLITSFYIKLSLLLSLLHAKFVSLALWGLSHSSSPYLSLLLLFYPAESPLSLSIYLSQWLTLIPQIPLFPILFILLFSSSFSSSSYFSFPFLSSYSPPTFYVPCLNLFFSAFSSLPLVYIHSV